MVSIVIISCARNCLCYSKLGLKKINDAGILGSSDEICKGEVTHTEVKMPFLAP